NLNFRSDRRLSKRNGNYAIDIVALALEKRVRLDPKHQVQISRRSAMDAGFTNSSKTNASSVFHSGRNLCINRLLLDHAPFTPAARTRIADHTARSVACGTSTRNAEESLLISDLPAAAAATASRRSFAVRASRSITLFAKLMLAVGDFIFRPEGCFFEFDGNVF